MATKKKAARKKATTRRTARRPRDPYLRLTVDTLMALDDAIALLRGRLMVATGDERRTINAELPELEADRAKVNARFLAYVSGRLAVQPPTDADLRKVAGLVKNLDQMIADATVASTVLDVATKILKLYSKTVQ